MKKYIALGLLASLLLTSCSVDWNDEKEGLKNIKECFKYQKVLEEKYKDIEHTSIKEIFYSPKKQSCLYIIDQNNIRSLIDYFSNTEVIPSRQIINNSGSNIDNAFSFEKEIERLKGE